MSLEICRICGTTEDLKNIFSEGNDELVEQIRLCANIEIDVYDCLPKFVCNECETGLEFSYRLRKRGEETEKKLRQDLMLTSFEPYSISDESIIHIEDDNLTEQFCDEEIWLTDDGAVHFSEQDGLIEGVSNSDRDILQDLAEEKPDDTIDEQWIGLENEDLSETVEAEEIIEHSVIERLEEDSIELVEIYGVQGGPKLEELKVEPKIVPKDKQYKCEVCCAVFDRKSKYMVHVKKHDDKRFNCGVCGKLFTYRYRYEEHMKNHFTSERGFPCSQCHKSYTNQGNMERHVRSAHNQERKFQCVQCGAGFGRSDILKMHMAKHTDERTIECEVCKKAFKTNQSLHYHMRIHANRPERPKKPRRLKTKPKPRTQIYQCDQCDKISHHRTTHMNHIRTHTGEKPFKCSTCDKAFRTTHARSNHQLLHTDKRPHTCKECGITFRQISHLKSHMLTHTGDKRHVCDVCHKAFTMRSNLVVHLRIHTGEMPYACNKCPRKFLLSSQFKRHKLSHAGEDGLQTESCKQNEVEIGGEFRGSQISLYIDDIIERTPEDEDLLME